ncbi:LIC_13387 family protein [Herpetosiphon llansteffanensis]|uniref:LIC_13387 family protein n=1 Tax=Herpetosiphon llansteffanensis TaxID=2094568 RepID=UPI000D7C6809|nr:hypothetical protein [Herpetosiphon llansteffanensis]
MQTSFLGKLGAWIFMIVGLGHLYFQLFKTAADSSAASQLQQIEVQLPGAQRSMLQLNSGFSLAMGYLLIGYGVLNLLILRALGNEPARLRAIWRFNSAVSLGLAVLSLRYFFIFPSSSFTITTVLYALASRQTQPQHPSQA